MIDTDGIRTVAHYRGRPKFKCLTNDPGKTNGGHFDPARAARFDRKLVRVDGQPVWLVPIFLANGERVMALDQN